MFIERHPVGGSIAHHKPFSRCLFRDTAAYLLAAAGNSCFTDCWIDSPVRFWQMLITNGEATSGWPRICAT
jgi:hypothetical protein